MAKEYKIKTLKNGEKRYIFDVNLGYRADGTRIRTTINAKSVKEGRKKAAALTLGNKEVENSDAMLFKDAYDLYQHYFETDPNFSPATVYSKQKKRNRYFHYFDNIKINKIKKVDIERWRNVETTHLGSQTVNDLERELSAFFNWLIKNEMLSTSPMKNYNKTKIEKHEMKIWNEEDFKTFYNELRKDEHKLMFATLFYTGLRIGELLGLQYCDIIGNELHLSHTLKYIKGKGYILSTRFKTPNSKRIVPIPEWLDLGDGEGRIFPYAFTTVRDIKKRTCKRAGIDPIRIHDFRHSYVAMLINKGVDIYTIKELLGHDTINTTLNTYGHLYDSKRKEITKLFNNKL